MTYDFWKYKVECLQEDRLLAEEDIHPVIRRSLKNEAAHVLKRMGHNVSVKQILAKFDGVYGVVETGEETMAEFYSTKQHKSEDVSTWGCRLEEMLERVTDAGAIGAKDTNEMLRKRFWSGLLPKLKEASRHKFDATTDFDRLRVIVRSIEQDFKHDNFEEEQTSKKTAVKMVKAKTENEATPALQEIQNMVLQLSTQVKEMGQRMQEMKASNKVPQYSNPEPHPASQSRNENRYNLPGQTGNRVLSKTLKRIPLMLTIISTRD